MNRLDRMGKFFRMDSTSSFFLWRRRMDRIRMPIVPWTRYPRLEAANLAAASSVKKIDLLITCQAPLHVLADKLLHHIAPVGLHIPA